MDRSIGGIFVVNVNVAVHQITTKLRNYSENKARFE